MALLRHFNENNSGKIYIYDTDTSYLRTEDPTNLKKGIILKLSEINTNNMLFFFNLKCNFGASISESLETTQFPALTSYRTKKEIEN